MGLVHWVWLGLALPPGSFKLDLALRRFPDPQELYEAGESGIAAIPELDEADAIRIRAATLDVAKRAMERAESFGAKILAKDVPGFPERLLSISACPPVLYVLGDPAVLSETPAIAMVGSRNYSDYGRRAAELIATGLAKAGVTIVSGIAAGIDSFSHTACLDAGGRTVAVQGCGIGVVYPAENAALKERIVSHGAVVSEFPPDAQPQSSFFPIRNRIVSGLSLGVLVVEAAARSGTSITANLAIDQGRDVFAVPNDVFKPNSKGTFMLLRQGAIPVSSAEDILESYPALFSSASVEKISPAAVEAVPSLQVKKKAPEGISPQAAAVYGLMERRPRHADEFSVAAGLSPAETAAALTELEIRGLAEQIAGRRFRLS